MKTKLWLGLLVALMAIPAWADNGQNSPADGASRPKKKGYLAQADEQISGQGYGMAGCGLGSLAFGEKPGFTQVFAATTNGTMGNQTFGISSGTSNCDQQITAGKKNAVAFIFGNREALERDIARGSGEALAGLSATLGCRDPGSLGADLKKDFQSIFPSESVTDDQVANTILRKVRTNAHLASQCSSIS